MCIELTSSFLQMLRLVSSDGKEFEIKTEHAVLSRSLSAKIAARKDLERIRFATIHSREMKLAVAYMEYCKGQEPAIKPREYPDMKKVCSDENLERFAVPTIEAACAAYDLSLDSLQHLCAMAIVRALPKTPFDLLIEQLQSLCSSSPI